MKLLPLLLAAVVTTEATANIAVAGPTFTTLIVRENLLPTPPRGPETAAIRDPFNWPGKQQKKFDDLSRKKLGNIKNLIRLDGIIYNPDTPLVLVNGKILTINDTIEGYRIETIAPDRITLRRGRSQQTIRLDMPSLRLGKGNRP